MHPLCSKATMCRLYSSESLMKQRSPLRVTCPAARSTRPQAALTHTLFQPHRQLSTDLRATRSKQQAPPLHTTQAARTSSASCVIRSAFSPPCLVSTLTQTLLHRGPSRAPTLTDSSGTGLVVPCLTSVAPQDRHMQEEPLHSPRAT